MMKHRIPVVHWLRATGLGSGHGLFIALVLILCQHTASSQSGAFSFWYGGTHLTLEGTQEETEHTEITSTSLADNWGLTIGADLGKKFRLNFLFATGKVAYDEDLFLDFPGASFLVESHEMELSYWNIGIAAGYRVLSSPRSDGLVQLGLGQRYLRGMDGRLINLPFGSQNPISEDLGNWKPDLLLSFGLRYSYLLFGVVAPFGEAYVAPTLVNKHSDNYDPDVNVNPPKVTSEWGFRLGLEIPVGKRDRVPVTE